MSKVVVVCADTEEKKVFFCEKFQKEVGLLDEQGRSDWLVIKSNYKSCFKYPHKNLLILCSFLHEVPIELRTKAKIHVLYDPFPYAELTNVTDKNLLFFKLFMQRYKRP